MRLTERKVSYPKCDKQGNLTRFDYIEIKDEKLAEEKLCQLEDVEEELGIDLKTLFKALREGIYVKTWGFANSRVGKDVIVKIRVPKLKLDYETHTYFAFEFVKKGITQTYKLCDYGKTWALTKEELESDKQ